MLAMLLQRKMEILNQLETMVGKQQQQEQQQQQLTSQIKTVKNVLFSFLHTHTHTHTVYLGIYPKPPVNITR